jgi:hypothetical protein
MLMGDEDDNYIVTNVMTGSQHGRFLNGFT